MRVVGRTDLRAQNDALGGVMKNAESHSVATMWGKADKVAEGLGGFTGEGGMINLEENWLIPMEPKKRTDIHCDAKQKRQRNLPVQRLTGGAVQDSGHVLQT